MSTLSAIPLCDFLPAIVECGVPATTEAAISPQFGETVSAALTRLGWSLRTAESNSGVAYNSVDRMKKGLGVEAENIIKLALAVAPKGEQATTARAWLQLGGKGYLVQVLDELAAQLVGQPQTAPPPQFPPGFDHLPPDILNRAAEAAQKAAKEAFDRTFRILVEELVKASTGSQVSSTVEMDSGQRIQMPAAERHVALEAAGQAPLSKLMRKTREDRRAKKSEGIGEK